MHKKLLLLLFILPLVGTFWFVAKNNPPVKTELKNSLGVSTPQTNLPTHPLVFFDRDTFYAGIEQSKKENKTFTNRISGGIIPHHLFPGFIITDFFSRLSQQNPTTIILIGPNHYERGDYKVISSLYGWETPSGIVEPNEQIIQGLVASKLIKVDETNLPKDHAVAGIMPFVKHYLPNTKVVLLLLSGFITKEDAQMLSISLKNYMDKDTIIVAAVDFSHYLTNPQAQEKDKTTFELMKSFNYDQLLSLNNDYLDSPPSVATLLMTMQTLGTTKMELLYHTNSGEMQKNNSIETTSYFSIVYY